MRPAFPTELFDGVYWERLLARAAEVPVAAIENAFGFEIRLGRPEPASDFCIVVPADGEVRSHYIGLARQEVTGEIEPACSAQSGVPGLDARNGAGRRLARDSLAACLREMEIAGSFANEFIANGATMLEYDVLEPRPGSHPSPGVFWDIAGPVKPAQVGEIVRLLAMASGMPVRPASRDVPGGGAPPEVDWAAALRHVADAATPYGCISQVGTFVGRQRVGVRVNVGRLEHEALAPLLDAIGWPGPVTAATDAMAVCGLPGMALAAALDVGQGGVGPRLGLELALPGGWAKSRWRHWNPFLDILVAKGWCRADKAAGLKRWCGLTTLYGRETYWIAKGMNHVKIGIQDDTVEAKAYLGACRRRAADMDPA